MREGDWAYSSNVPILTVSQALAMSVGPVVVFIGGIVGTDLAPSPSLATLPISIMIVGVALSTIPASILMRRIGRRAGFMIGATISSLACLVAAAALSQDSFLLFCLAALLIGTNSAFVQQYRFAAAESVSPGKASQAVSFVLIGGILAGYLGPELAKLSRNWLAGADYSGSFVLMAVVNGVAFALLGFLKNPVMSQVVVKGSERPLRQVMSQPVYLIALFISVLAYGVMSFIMTATPVEMHKMHGFTIDQTAWVIQSHIIAMYLPSLFTGYLIGRLGVVRVIMIGIFCMLGTVSLGIIGRELLHYWSALVLLGVGWNFLFIGGTVLLTGTYTPAERFKAQAVNDFTIFAIQAFTSLSAATVLFNANWEVLILLNLPAILIALSLVIVLRKQLDQVVPLSAAD